MKQIKSLPQLKQESTGGAEFFVLLRGNLRSSKFINWNGNTFYVLNYIDDSEQEFTQEQLMDRQETIIGEALTKGALYKYEEQP